MQFRTKPNTLVGEIGLYRNILKFMLLKSPTPAHQETKLIGMITLKGGGELTATREMKAFQAPFIIPSGNKHIENRSLEIA